MCRTRIGVTRDHGQRAAGDSYEWLRRRQEKAIALAAGGVARLPRRIGSSRLELGRQRCDAGRRARHLGSRLCRRTAANSAARYRRRATDSLGCATAAALFLLSAGALQQQPADALLLWRQPPPPYNAPCRRRFVCRSPRCGGARRRTAFAFSGRPTVKAASMSLSPKTGTVSSIT